MFVMLVGPSEDIIESKVESSHWAHFEITKGGLEPPEPNASYAPEKLHTMEKQRILAFLQIHTGFE